MDVAGALVAAGLQPLLLLPLPLRRAAAAAAAAAASGGATAPALRLLVLRAMTTAVAAAAMAAALLGAAGTTLPLAPAQLTPWPTGVPLLYDECVTLESVPVLRAVLLRIDAAGVVSATGAGVSTHGELRSTPPVVDDACVAPFG